MAAGLPDTVDCVRLAEDAAVLERTYELRSLPRIKDLLAESAGSLHASFAFSTTESGRPCAHVEVYATSQLTCQRCMKGFAARIRAASDVEFAADETRLASGSQREIFVAPGDRVSLRDLAEEELLLAMPIAPACDAPRTCANAPGLVDPGGAPVADEARRPFSALQDLLNKDRT